MPHNENRDFTRQRERMLTEIKRNNVRDERILAAFRSVPREQFVPPELQRSTYGDTPLPIGSGQTISQPFIVAYMIQLAGIGPTSRVLEIGTGSGYAAAIMSQLAEHVYTIERRESLFESAQQRLRMLGYCNVEVRLGDGTGGWPEQSPFDAIVVAAAAAQVPAGLIKQLCLGGRLIIPVGQHPDTQTLLRIIRTTAAGDYRTEDFGGVSFVPLISGANGFADVNN